MWWAPPPVAVLSLKGGRQDHDDRCPRIHAGVPAGDRVSPLTPARPGHLSDKLTWRLHHDRDLLNEKDTISRYADIRVHVPGPVPAEVLASDQDPAVSEALSEYDYREVARIVEHFY